MIVKDLHWISESAREAELLITDGNYACLAFSCPCKLNKGDEVFTSLKTFMAERIMTAKDKDISIKQLKKNHLEHYCVAEIIDINNSLVRIGDIFITIDEDLPKDCINGDVIEFFCGRLDIY